MPRDKYEGSIGARASVTIEFGNLGSWGTTYTMDQIIDQARESAEQTVRKAFKDEAYRNVRITAVDVTAVYAPGHPIKVNG